MARIARVVIANFPHHIVQRGNRNQNVFFSDQDKRYYLKLLHKYAQETGLTFWAYCLMNNHVHLVTVPQREDSLAKGIGKTHKHYTSTINSRESWRGYLWQGRFSSYPMDEQYLYAAVRYVERNPVRAGLVKKAENYFFSSAKAHVFKKKDLILSDNFMLSEIKDWASYLAEEDKETDRNLFERHIRIGRPLGDEGLIVKLEKITGRNLKKKKPGPKKKKR